jgi:SAM-dependent methyltransferase
MTNVAPGWEKWAGQFRAQLRPAMDWILRAARIAPGVRMLDVATGVGQPALPACDRVRPNGRVVGVDTSSEMLAACRRIARQSGADNLELREMDMHSLAFPDESFDAVTCGFGLMFARDPVRVLSEIRRVMKQGAWFALAVWDEPARNPFFVSALGALPVPTPTDPKSPGPFRLAGHGELQSVLRAAGFGDFTIENVQMVIESASPEDHWQMVSETMPSVKGVLDGKTPDEVARVRDALIAAVAPYADRGKIRIGTTALCACASR